jgi:S-adenosylmethionine:tRNA ribosyltransferase-isomerase
MYRLSDYQYTLPEGHIAQTPTDERDGSRLLVLHRRSGRTAHHRFRNLPDLLRPRDLLVVNNTKVIPGRLVGNKETGGKAELLILDFEQSGEQSGIKGPTVCTCLVKSTKRPKPGTRLFFDASLEGRVIDGENGRYMVEFFHDGRFMDALYRTGHIPLPPYIRRKKGHPTPEDDHSYQTVYARYDGAVAAPTAGLHFTPALLHRLKKKGIGVTEITLHVSYGTFLPVRQADIREHRIHAERYHVSEATAAQIRTARGEGSRIVAVGTTCVRTLEFASDKMGNVRSGSGQCDLFIYPGYRFKVVDALITNFHLPQSTLLMLVSAFAGRERILEAYQEAIRKGYRFYSYGDAMLIR